MNQPKYVRRFEQVTRALKVLAMHANGLPLRQLADSLGTDPEALREELRVYFSADMPWQFYPRISRPQTIRFHDAEGVDAPPEDAEYVSATPRSTVEVGADFVSVTELARIYRAGQDLLAVEPGNTDLEKALDALTGTALQGIGTRQSVWLADLAATFSQAMHEQRRVRITYARAWEPGVREHVIRPYRLIKTRRGWELDAGVDDERVGTFLLSGVRSADVLGETFERPDDVEQRIAANRREQPVDIAVPQDQRWVVERFAESVEVINETEDEIRLRAYLLEPIERRLALLMVVAGPSAFVYTPTSLRDAGTNFAYRLLEHHREPPS